MLEYIQENWPDTPIAVMGHSMGGFTALGAVSLFREFSGRSLLSLRGGADDVVDGAAQELYLEKLAQRDDVKTQSIVYDDLGHFVTTNMMGDAVNWLQAELH